MARKPLPLAGVAGWPVGHSLSPVMMNAWLEASGLDGQYAAFAVAPDRFADAIQALPALGIAGLNVTVPHKGFALEAATSASEAARAIGAANLLLTRDDGLFADNTDIVGIEAAIKAGGGAEASRPAVIVGAGGAARAAMFHVKQAGVSEVRVINRTVESAEALAQDFGVAARAFPLDQAETALEGAGLVIQSSVMGMQGRPDFAPDLSGLDGDALVFDMVYAPLVTPLLGSARDAGRRTADGLSMLIGQAQPSFEAFFGAPPPEIDMRAILLDALGQGPAKEAAR